jgi:SpoIID/LytB domain protein
VTGRSPARRTIPKLIAAALATLVTLAGTVVGGIGPSSQTAVAAPAPTPTASFKFQGSGYGHGIGLSQWGAQAMAKAGKTATNILQYYYTGVTVGTKTAGNIRVQIRQASTVTLRFTGAAGNVGPAAVTQGGVVTLKVSGSQVVASGAATANGTSLNITWAGSNNCSGYVMVDGATGTKGYCRGNMTATVIDGKINLIATLRLTDEYLYGLAEVPSTWETEALKAQAIAGRSYAFNQGYKASCNCEVYSDTRSQAYTGRAKEKEGPSENGLYGQRWVTAVNATFSGTSGQMVLDSSGNVVTAYYSSSSGGRTENNEDVWAGSANPNMRSVNDPWSLDAINPNASWTTTVTAAQATTAFGLANIVSIQVTKRDAAGYVKTLTATSTSGTARTLTGQDTIRTALGLKSAYFSIDSPPPPAQVRTPFAQIVLSPDLNGDGRGEVVAVDADGKLVYYPYNKSNALGTVALIDASFGTKRLYAPGDWNKDGYNDLMGVSSDGKLYLMTGNGHGVFSAPLEIGHGWTPFRIIPCGDLNNDGTADLLAIDAGGVLWLYGGTGKGGFLPTPKQAGHGWVGLELYAAGDLTADGRNDILMLDKAGKLYAYAGRGNGTFSPGYQVGQGWTGLTLSAGADLNADGKADIVGRLPDGRLFFYAGRGNGTFTAATQIGNGW